MFRIALPLRSNHSSIPHVRTACAKFARPSPQPQWTQPPLEDKLQNQLLLASETGLKYRSHRVAPKALNPPQSSHHPHSTQFINEGRAYSHMGLLAKELWIAIIIPDSEISIALFPALCNSDFRSVVIEHDDCTLAIRLTTIIPNRHQHQTEHQ